MKQTDAADGRRGPKDEAQTAGSKTATSRPPGQKAPSTIQFSEGMEFIGRTTSPEGEPAGRADFYGIVTAQMEDALLYCQDKMIAYTDRVVPLAELGAMSKTRSQPKPGNDAEPADAPVDPDAGAEEKPQPQLTLIKCFRNAVAITRKVDPDTRVLLKQERIEADDVLSYDRRTGAFDAPGRGTVYLYDRSDNSGNSAGMNVDFGPTNDANPKPAQRPIKSTSGRVAKRSDQAAGSAAVQTQRTTGPPDRNAPALAKTGAVPALVLTQIHFEKGMRGVYMAGTEDDAARARWSEFFGDVELARAKVDSAKVAFNFDRLPSDAMFLTGQTMRGISEPPPVGSPPSAPTRDSFKAWEKAYFKSSDKTLQADWITYDSEKDLIYAFAEGERGVIYAQQHAAGQPSTLGSAKAVRHNPKNGATEFIDNASIQMIDKNTGVRPVPAVAPDPDAKVKKPAKKPFKVPNNNLERRGFTGQ